jgi:hypothetical protein
LQELADLSGELFGLRIVRGEANSHWLVLGDVPDEHPLELMALGIVERALARSELRRW